MKLPASVHLWNYKASVSFKRSQWSSAPSTMKKWGFVGFRRVHSIKDAALGALMCFEKAQLANKDVGRSLVESRLWGICGGFSHISEMPCFEGCWIAWSKNCEKRWGCIVLCMLLSFPTMGQFNVEKVVGFFFQNIVIFYNSMIVGEIMQKMTTPNYLSGKSRADLIFMFLRTLFWRDKHVGFRMGWNVPLTIWLSNIASWFRMGNIGPVFQWKNIG